MPRCVLFLLCFAALATSAGERLVYPLHSKGEDPEAYVVELLRLALAHSGGDYQLEPSLEPMPQSRAQLSLERNDGRVQLMWTMTTREREADLLPIRIPIYKGLISWRVFLVRADQRDLLAGVTRREQLEALRMGQRHDWPDTDILRANGLTVVTTPGYENLFRMLDAGRFELFPAKWWWPGTNSAAPRPTACTWPWTITWCCTTPPPSTSSPRASAGAGRRHPARPGGGHRRRQFRAPVPALPRRDAPRAHGKAPGDRAGEPRPAGRHPIERDELWYHPAALK